MNKTFPNHYTWHIHKPHDQRKIYNTVYNIVLQCTFRLFRTCAILVTMLIFSTKISVYPDRCYAEPLVFVKTFSYWSVYYELKKNNIMVYHAISFPNSTKVYSGLRNTPYIAVTYLSPRMYTISMYSGFIIDTRSPLILRVDDKTYTLHTLHDSFGYTYSSVQDIELINDFIKNSCNTLEARSYDATSALAVDYYMLFGLKEALLYIDSRQYTKN